MQTAYTNGNRIQENITLELKLCFKIAHQRPSSALETRRVYTYYSVNEPKTGEEEARPKDWINWESQMVWCWNIFKIHNCNKCAVNYFFFVSRLAKHLVLLFFVRGWSSAHAHEWKIASMLHFDTLSGQFNGMLAVAGSRLKFFVR